MTPFPLRIGSAEAPVLPSAGIAITRFAEPVTGAEDFGWGPVRVSDVTPVSAVDGLEAIPVGSVVVLPLAAVEGMRRLGLKLTATVYTPEMLETDAATGVRYAPGLIRHADVESHHN